MEVARETDTPEVRRAARRLRLVLGVDLISAGGVATLVVVGEELPLPGFAKAAVIAVLLGVTLAAWNARLVAAAKEDIRQDFAQWQAATAAALAGCLVHDEQYAERIAGMLADIQAAVERRIDAVTADHDRQIYTAGYTAGITQQN